MQIQSKSIKINFKFKAFHKYQFKLVLPKILQKTKGLSLQNKSFASLPLKIQRFTVLRSPHVDKKSREQFELKVSSKLLTIYFNPNDFIEKQKAKVLINFIKNSSSGLGLKISYTV
jgi:small subunit ribosomal protein S10